MLYHKTIGNILVIGDVMLDVFIEGRVDRISPEAPVPVFLTETRNIYPGGAANVANNICCMGGGSSLIGVVGNEEDSKIFDTSFHPHILDSYLFVDTDRPSTVKTRFIANGQQIVRVDSETSNPIPAEIENAIINQVDVMINRISLIVISDYAKGVLTDRVLNAILKIANNNKVQVIVDPKSRDFMRYSGAWILKPNTAELHAATGMDTSSVEGIQAACARVMEFLSVEYMLVTRAEHGMLLVNRNKVTNIPSAKRQVFDVVGAGDTALATLAVFISEGGSVVDSCYAANYAAGIAVQKHGTSVVTREELENDFVRA
jgi:D-beta-D-heptose 7-phosphate kinase/D-beta-D-heptose 1-phosphate adenosyltransferase